MEIRNFCDKDHEQAVQVVYNEWAHMFDEPENIKKTLYKFMISHYDLNRKYSFSVLNPDLKGFLLAALKSDENNSNENLKKELDELSTKERKIGLEFLKYFEHNECMVKKHMQEDDIMLCLFMSNLKGCGKILLKELVKVCNENGIKNIFLWTDTSCNHDYYAKNGYQKLDTYSFLDIHLHKTFVYKKSLV